MPIGAAQSGNSPSRRSIASTGFSPRLVKRPLQVPSLWLLVCASIPALDFSNRPIRSGPLDKRQVTYPIGRRCVWIPVPTVICAAAPDHCSGFPGYGARFQLARVAAHSAVGRLPPIAVRRGNPAESVGTGIPAHANDDTGQNPSTDNIGPAVWWYGQAKAANCQSRHAICLILECEHEHDLTMSELVTLEGISGTPGNI